jgi:hypothetical protein
MVGFTKILEMSSELVKLNCYKYLCLIYFKEAVKECRYLTSSDDALHVYSYLYNEQTRPAHNMDLVYQPSSRKIGSKKFQKVKEKYLSYIFYFFILMLFK